MSKKQSDVDEYNRAVEEVARATGALGLEQEEDGFPPLPKLNIGGQEFQTKISVLRSQPGSLLTAVFMGEEECEYDETGRFFFDHDPSYFHNVLDFMRTGDCVIPYERGAFEHFRRQVEYWRLEALETRCEAHYQKHIKPFLSDKAGGGRSRKGPNGRATYAKALAAQRRIHGAACDAVVEGVAGALAEGAALGHATATLTAYKPPEYAGRPGLPLWKAPSDWAASNVTYCWDPSLAAFFAPVEGVGALLSASGFLVASLAERGYTAVAKQDASGFSYEVSCAADEQ